jgi:hypothetical protein
MAPDLRKALPQVGKLKQLISLPFEKEVKKARFGGRYGHFHTFSRHCQR